MKLRHFAILALFACGGEDPGPDLFPADAGPPGQLEHIIIYVDDDGNELDREVGDIGTLQQPLYIPTGYGTEADPDTSRCWDGSGCVHTGSKTYPRKFYASTCDAWQQSRFVAAEVRAKASTSANGSSAGATWTFTNGTKNEWRCGNNSDALALDPELDGSIGVSIVSINVATKKIVSADVWIFVDNMEGQPGWWNRSQAQVQKFYENAILHEILHTMALGHADAMLPSVLMNAFVSESYYTSNLSVTGTERGWLVDYTP